MYGIVLTANARDDLASLQKADQVTILAAADQQLTTQPTIPTRNRKALLANAISEWELRVGAFRVFYDVEVDDQLVIVKAVGWKEHNRLYFRGVEFKL